MNLADRLQSLTDPKPDADVRSLSASVGIPAVTPKPDYPLGVDGIVTVVGSIAALIFFLRRKFFQDNTDISKSKAESNIIATLAEQAETYKRDARDAWARRTEDAETIARQAEEIKNLRATLGMVIEVLREVAPERAQVFNRLPWIKSVSKGNQREQGSNKGLGGEEEIPTVY